MIKSTRNIVLLILFIIILSSLVLIQLSLTNNLFSKNSANTDDAVLPKVQGVVLTRSQPIENFTLVNHHNQTFSQKNLIGKWHFITYGYTHCPDICPTTLITLTQVIDKLRMLKQANNSAVIFYSIDNQRDTVQILANYIQYFDESFIALRADNLREQQSFEASLSIKANIAQTKTSYQVSHGLNIFIINPEGKLQAVFIPQRTELGFEPLTTEQLVEGFIQIKNYYQIMQKT